MLDFSLNGDPVLRNCSASVRSEVLSPKEDLFDSKRDWYRLSGPSDFSVILVRFNEKLWPWDSILSSICKDLIAGWVRAGGGFEIGDRPGGEVVFFSQDPSSRLSRVELFGLPCPFPRQLTASSYSFPTHALHNNSALYPGWSDFSFRYLQVPLWDYQFDLWDWRLRSIFFSQKARAYLNNSYNISS